MPSRPLGRLVPNPKLKLADQCREVMRFRQWFGARTVPRPQQVERHVSVRKWEDYDYE